MLQEIRDFVGKPANFKITINPVNSLEISEKTSRDERRDERSSVSLIVTMRHGYMVHFGVACSASGM